MKPREKEYERRKGGSRVENGREKGMKEV